jgi:hypothetical protein
MKFYILIFSLLLSACNSLVVSSTEPGDNVVVTTVLPKGKDCKFLEKVAGSTKNINTGGLRELTEQMRIDTYYAGGNYLLIGNELPPKSGQAYRCS